MAPDNNRKEIFVYTHNSDQQEPLLMGVLLVSEVRGKEVFSFEYDPSFLESEWAFDLDPNLRLYQGTQYLPDEQANFGIFLDSSPDRWGRVLMQRREAALASIEERKPKRLQQSDYLLGVYDASRMGALRFKTNPDGPFLDDNHRHATPPMTSLRELERATLELETDTDLQDEKYLQRLSLLVAPGSSLGGALWIAKFPSQNDEFDQGAWEYIAYQLAQKSGINMAKSQASVYYSKQHTFLTKRFDRTNDNQRLHFFSAMTLLGYTDGADSRIGASYLELAELLMQRGGKPNADLEQLWRRIVFSICISNTDDHLRNHGFLLTRQGLRLSPAFDLNPNPRGYGLTLNINEQHNALDIDLALEVAPYFRLDNEQAQKIVSIIKQTVSGWNKIAESLGLDKSEIDTLAPAFKS